MAAPLIDIWTPERRLAELQSAGGARGHTMDTVTPRMPINATMHGGTVRKVM